MATELDRLIVRIEADPSVEDAPKQVESSDVWSVTCVGEDCVLENGLWDGKGEIRFTVSLPVIQNEH